MIKKIVLWILVVFWMGLIFYFSSFNRIESTEQSQGFLYKTLGNVIEIIKPNISEVDKEELIIELDPIVRKIAHASEFFVLSILIYFLLKQYNIKKIYIITLLLCFLYASSDEIHQLFVLNRSAQIIDVFIDTCGSLLSLIIIYIGGMIICK